MPAWERAKVPLKPDARQLALDLLEEARTEVERAVNTAEMARDVSFSAGVFSRAASNLSYVKVLLRHDDLARERAGLEKLHDWEDGLG
jgi:hypothetical protein